MQVFSIKFSLSSILCSHSHQDGSLDIALSPCVSEDPSLPKSVDITVQSSVSEDFDPSFPNLEDCENAEGDVFRVVEKVSFEHS